jgi:hypothetical protein
VGLSGKATRRTIESKNPETSNVFAAFMNFLLQTFLLALIEEQAA